MLFWCVGSRVECTVLEVVVSFVLFCLQDKWLEIVHHVCGEHEWDGGCCSHGPLTETEGGKEYLAMNSKAAKELKKVVLDREWMKSLHSYVLFRYMFVVVVVVFLGGGSYSLWGLCM